ncbi:hypothetical protein ACIQ2D_17760 [Lysinibacillus sp. NPDC097287]|uniref:hypothetical protein n=1 Tax=Lysinibacillus sp. NPDC097287 TaxID=3364144 RepID=UPI0037F2B352
MILAPLPIEHAYMTFLFPFAYHTKNREELSEQLENEGFTFFTLQNKELENAFYGNDITVSHEEIAQFFYPFVEDKLFPTQSHAQDFLRFSKSFNVTGYLQSKHEIFPYELLSIDITLCPFGNGIITTRLKMTDEVRDFSDVVNFIHYFRILEAKLDEEKGTSHHFAFGLYQSTSDLLFQYFLPFLEDYLIDYKTNTFGGLPFLEDERMLASAYLLCKENAEIIDEHLFRLGQVDGKKPDGQPFISSTNPDYITDYVAEHTHMRWAPTSYIVTSTQAQITISNRPFSHSIRDIEKFMGKYYYNLLIHYFYKMMLLKVSFEHSEISWNKDKFVVDDLIELITRFSSHYYFDEVVVRSEGKEISHMLRKIFRIQENYLETKTTLDNLYRALEDRSDKRNNKLLFILTVFTVVSGIYGMNLVIEEWNGQVNWSNVWKFSFFEWLALLTALSGITLSFVLICYSTFTVLRNHLRRYKRNGLK